MAEALAAPIDTFGTLAALETAIPPNATETGGHSRSTVAFDVGQDIVRTAKISQSFADIAKSPIASLQQDIARTARFEPLLATSTVHTGFGLRQTLEELDTIERAFAKRATAPLSARAAGFDASVLEALSSIDLPGQIFQGLAIPSAAERWAAVTFPSASLSTAFIPRVPDFGAIGHPLITDITTSYERLGTSMGEVATAGLVDLPVESETAPPGDIRRNPALAAATAALACIGVVWLTNDQAGQQLTDIATYFVETGWMLGNASVDLYSRADAVLPSTRLVDWTLYLILANRWLNSNRNP